MLVYGVGFHTSIQIFLLFFFLRYHQITTTVTSECFIVKVKAL